uniref:Lipoxygenase domain-containing protein n=1 Tax=Chenopodium quinoa TaxID=63459 RepID=A0A803KQD5_CHEQI
MFDRRNLTSDGVGSPVHKFEGHKAVVLCWSPDNPTVFGSAAEDGVLNIWDYEKVGKKKERGVRTTNAPPGLFFQHAGHRDKMVDFHWNTYDAWTIVSVSDDNDSSGGGGTLQLAKAYVAVTDAGYHQLISHCTQTALNPNGLFEQAVFLRQYSAVWSSKLYKDWVFTDQALPRDLVQRGMAVKDSESPHGYKLHIKDYPYAVDGLEVWSAIETWVQEYCSSYYESDDMVATDPELQFWWKEIREVGHGDKKDQDCHKGEAIGKSVEACLEHWGIEDKLFTITIDNASSNDVA